MTALLEYLYLLCIAWEAKQLHVKQISNILKSKYSKFLIRKCIDKDLACRLFLFITAGDNM